MSGTEQAFRDVLLRAGPVLLGLWCARCRDLHVRALTCPNRKPDR